MSTTEEARIIPVFKTITQQNPRKTKEAGRPIFDDLEVVEVRFAGDRQRVGCFPAHSFARWVTNADGSQEQQTYAMRWPDQYRRFKMKLQQVMEGTPLEELPFLAQSKRMELKALNVHTAESLAALDGNELKALGMGGRELKNQAQAYLDKAAGSADVVKLAAENALLKESLSQVQAQMAAMGKRTEPVGFDAWEDDRLKAFIKEKTGQAPRGQPSHATLVTMANDIGQDVAA